MLRVNGEKMSKSLGNFIVLRELLATDEPEAVRLLLLRTHYRSELDFLVRDLVEMNLTLDRFYRALMTTPPDRQAEPDELIVAALCDDLNTPLAIARMHELASAAIAGDRSAANGLHAGAALLGLLERSPDMWFRGIVPDDTVDEIDRKVEERKAAKRARDYAKADRIRAELKSIGIVLEDSGTETVWRRA